MTFSCRSPRTPLGCTTFPDSPVLSLFVCFDGCISLLPCFWPCWAFTAARGLSLVVVSRDCSPVVVCGLLPAGLLLLWSTLDWFSLQGFPCGACVTGFILADQLLAVACGVFTVSCVGFHGLLSSWSRSRGMRGLRCVLCRLPWASL